MGINAFLLVNLKEFKEDCLTISLSLAGILVYFLKLMREG